MTRRGALVTAALSTAILLVAGGCGSEDEPIAKMPQELVLMTHDSFALSEGTLEKFTADTGIAVTVLRSGDAGTMLSQAILTRDNPIADVIFGVDNTFCPGHSPKACLQNTNHRSSATFIPNWSPTNGLLQSTSATYASTTIKRPSRTLPHHQTLRDLTKPEYGDMLVVQDPASSSPGLAFLLATIGTFGEDGDYTWRTYWEDLEHNGVLVASGWTEAYQGAFTAGGGGGDRPIVVSYASSPAVGVYFSDPPPSEAPTASLLDGCFRQIEYAAVVTGTGHEAAAGLLIDHLLSVPVQEDIPLNMFVFPANSQAAIPDVFTDFSPVPDAPVEMTADAIEQNREKWIDEWTDILR